MGITTSIQGTYPWNTTPATTRDIMLRLTNDQVVEIIKRHGLSRNSIAQACGRHNAETIIRILNEAGITETRHDRGSAAYTCFVDQETAYQDILELQWRQEDKAKTYDNSEMTSVAVVHANHPYHAGMRFTLKDIEYAWRPANKGDKKGWLLTEPECEGMTFAIDSDATSKWRGHIFRVENGDLWDITDGQRIRVGWRKSSSALVRLH